MEDSGLGLISDYINANLDPKPDGFDCEARYNGISDFVIMNGLGYILHVFSYHDREIENDTYQFYVTHNTTDVKLSAVRKWYKNPTKLAKYVVKQLKKLS